LKNYAVIFCENRHPDENIIDLHSKVFCLPFFKIQEAMEFCELEDSRTAYIGFRNGEWKIDLDKTGMQPAIKINKNGIAESNKSEYLWIMKRITPRPEPCMRDQSAGAGFPSFPACSCDSECN
jgi:hypothetical protein